MNTISIHMPRRRTVRLVFQLFVLAAFIAISFMARANATETGAEPVSKITKTL